MYQQLQAIKSLQSEQQLLPYADNRQIANNQFLNNQAGVWSNEALKKEKQSQLIRITMNSDIKDINLQQFEGNFQNLYRGNDAKYYVSRMRISGLIPNIDVSSNFYLQLVNVVFYDPQAGKTYVVKKSINNYPNQKDWVFEQNSWLNLYMGKPGEYLTTIEVVRNIQRQLEYVCADQINQQTKTFQESISGVQLAAEIFKTTELQFDNPNGKMMFVQKTKNMQNYYDYPAGTLVELDTGNTVSTPMLKQQLFIASFDVMFLFETLNAKRIARQLGLQPSASSETFYTYSLLQSMWQAQVLSNFLLTSVWSVSDEGIIDAITATTSSDMLEVYIPFHLPSNMFWTTYIQVGTSLTTNSWSNEDGRSNILYKGQIKNSGQEIDTLEKRNDQQVMHQTSVESLRSFRMFLLDQYNLPLKSLNEVELEIVVLFQ